VPESSPSNASRPYRWIFLALAFVLSWVFWIPAALSGQNVRASAWTIPHVLGGFGPSAAGIILVYRTQDREGRRAFWARVWGFKRISLPWYLFILFIFPIVVGLSVVIDLALGYPLQAFPTLDAIRATPVALIGMIVIGVVTGPLSEELGWRGFGLDRFQARRSPLAAALIIGAFWAVWHLPLFLMRGTNQYAWQFGSVRFWLFLLASLPLSIIFTWAANHNHRSILAAVLLHFMYAFTLSLIHPFPTRVYAYVTALLCLVAVGIVFILGRSAPPEMDEYE